MTLVIDYARELGLLMRGLHMGHHVGWTTNQPKAETLRFCRYEIDVTQDDETVTVEREVRVQFTPSMDKRPEARKFDGWEISFPVGARRL